MNNLCKKVLSMVLVAAITLGMLPLKTYAASTTNVILGGNSGAGITLNSATPYWKNGATTATSNETDYNAYFDSAKGTLTLKDATITDYYSKPTYENFVGIYVKSGDLNIILIGTNTVDISAYTSYNTCYGLWLDETYGTGKLTFDSSSTGSLTAKGGSSPESGRGSWGIAVSGALTINGGTINATGGPALNLSAGIQARGGTVINGGTITAIGHKMAFSSAPNVPGYFPEYVASANIDGSNPTTYSSANNGSYKYLKIVTADSGAPTVTMNQASQASYTSATLNGKVNANNASTTVTFQYGLTNGYGTTVTATQSPITGKSEIPVSKEITGLTPNTTYHYRIVAENSRGTTYGSDSIFSTLKVQTIGDVPGQSPMNTGTDLNNALIKPTVSANGFSITAQGWESSADGNTDWTSIPSGSICNASVNGYYLRYFVTYIDGTSKKIYSPNIVQLTIKRYTPTLTLSGTPNSPQFVGTKVTLTAVIKDGYNTGNQNYLNTVPVTFKDGTTTLGTATIAANTGIVTFETIALVAGDHNFTVEFPGDEAYNTNVTSNVVNYIVNINPDIATINNAKSAVENASYLDMTQAPSTDETSIEAAIKDTAKAAVNDSTVTVTVNKISYTEPIAGTLANPSGTNGSYVFSITVSKGNQTQTSVQKTIIITATPYAAIPTYEVSGEVQDKDSNNVLGATVKIMYGQKHVGLTEQTDLDGKFKIVNVPNGTYNLVVSKSGIIVTTMIVISGDNYAAGTIKLPSVKTNSVVEVTGQDTPSVVVGGLKEQFENTVTDDDKGLIAADQTLVINGGSVEIKLTAEKKDNTATNASDILAVATPSGITVGMFVDLSVVKTVTPKGGSATVIPLVELPGLIEVFIPLPAALQGQSNYVVYRYHGMGVDTITTMANADGEKIELVDNNTTIKLTVKKFSTYAIAYKASGSGSDGDSASDSSVVSTVIITEQSKGGKITISNDKKTATITPNDGFVIADVMVDGKSIGATGKYKFTDNKVHTIKAVFVKQSALPYYNQNEVKIYIGFSAIVENLYKYITPTGVNVEFKENQKNFTDNTIAWAKPSIDFVTEREIFLGTEQDKFGPNESMTRAMFVTAIGRLYERSYGSVSGTNAFSDVNSNDYYAKYVAWANENGIIKGIGENKFAPNDKVTREQMAVIMLNFATFLKRADVKDSSLAYADSASISSWAIDGAKYCQGTKMITGRDGGSFAPQESATRAEVAVMIERFIKTIVNTTF